MENNDTELIGGIFSSDDVNAEIKLSTFETWGYGLLFVTVINLSSVTGILFFPLMKKSFYTIVMRCMIGLAIGSLSGSALFHLIPQAFGLSHESQQNYMQVAAFIGLAVWMVMLLECTIKIVVKSRAIRRQKKGKTVRDNESYTQDNNNPSRKSLQNSELGIENVVSNGYLRAIEPLKLESDDESEKESQSEETQTRLSHAQLPVFHSTFSLNKHVIEAMKGSQAEEDKSIKTVAWIVIIGDSLHNFIDGVSIGAGFTQSFSTGVILSLAVMCEEFPHELGDFAILINSGFSVKKAILFNFLSALTCYMGLALGILLGKIEFENLIFAFAAGIFLYVALADMIPEVTSLIDEVSEISPKQAWVVLANHNIGILLGVVILYLLATYNP